MTPVLFHCDFCGFTEKPPLTQARRIRCPGATVSCGLLYDFDSARGEWTLCGGPYMMPEDEDGLDPSVRARVEQHLRDRAKRELAEAAVAYAVDKTQEKWERLEKAARAVRGCR